MKSFYNQYPVANGTRNGWVSLSLGAYPAKLTRSGKKPVQFTGSYERNFQDDYVVPKWPANFTVKFLFPILSK
jgi:hypothetical protein